MRKGLNTAAAGHGRPKRNKLINAMTAAQKGSTLNSPSAEN